MVSSSSYYLRREEIVGSWAVQKPVGEGGQAEVWRVKHRSEPHAPPAALKLLKHIDQKSRARFQREIELLKANRHTGIVSVRDSGEHRGRPYFLMELANTSLERLTVNDTGGIRVLHEAPVLLLDFFRQACAAVAHLHANNVLHRDIKPSNILLMLDGPDPMRAVLCDLGIGAPLTGQQNITATQEAVGTPIYRAPEALFGAHTKQSDVYSLGKTLEFIFTRVTPSQLGVGRCARDARLSVDAWDALDRVLERACATELARRFADVNALLNALPSLFVTCVADAPAATTMSASTVSLGGSEVLALATVIAACPTSRESISVFAFQRSRRRHLSEYEWSIALHRLESIGFLESHEETNFNGDEYSAVRPTSEGLRWAIDHPDIMQGSGDAETAAEGGRDEDIPF